MSSKGRKPAGDNGEEFYPTDPRAVLALIESPLLELPGGRWLEPCAGTGRIIATVNQHRRDARWNAFEIDGRHEVALRRVVDTVVIGDFLRWPAPSEPRFAVAIMNPPFSLTMAFVAAALDHARIVCMLQRTNWFGSQGRAAFLRTHCPDVYTLPFRPSFRPDGATDSVEYSWFVWSRDNSHRRGATADRTGRIAMLDAPTAGQASLTL